jgi:uncharacterized protein YecE (DUF72 family)
MKERNKLYIGTSGYSYKDWIGPFYPEGTIGSDMLGYYSRYFDFTEINSTFYHMPGLGLFRGLDKKTPENFRFTVKLYKGFTHDRNMSEKEAEMFLYSLQPIYSNGKLICILAQFPYSFHLNRENVDYLKKLREWFKDYEISIEFRNAGWIRGGVMRLLRTENLGFVCVDEPKIDGLIGKVAEVTSDIAYIRFHGRNKAAWYSGEGSARYDYRYSMEELLEWVPKVIELRGKSGYTVVSFNNHPIGKAIESAKIMQQLLSAQG